MIPGVVPAAPRSPAWSWPSCLVICVLSAGVSAREPARVRGERIIDRTTAAFRERDATGQWRWYMYYSYRGRNGVLPGIRLATSRDGTLWERRSNANDPAGKGHLFASTPDAYSLRVHREVAHASRTGRPVHSGNAGGEMNHGDLPPALCPSLPSFGGWHLFEEVVCVRR